ncbi:MAG: GAF domain-containing sensor histidine kinase, partial [Desulfohalobiaceae bacterium]|nr:GAF domain-containing sensor histidine kinase [Desulfohalobiaceae bacterium]
MQRLQDRQVIISRLANALADSGSPFTYRLRRSLSIVREDLGAAESMLHVFPAGAERLVLRENGLPSGQESAERSWEAVADHVLSSREPLRIDDVRKDHRFRHACSGGEVTNHALLASPLFSTQSEIPIGVLLAAGPSGFAPTELDGLATLGQWISPFIADRLRNGENPLGSPETESPRESGESAATSGESRLEDLEFVIHDLKSPLASLMTNLDILHGISSSEKQAFLARTALTSANKLYQRITQFLELSRLEVLNSQSNALYPVDLEQAVAKQLREHQSLLEEKQIRLSTDGAGGIMVKAKESLLHHLLQNVISNAIRHTPAGGSITLYWTRHKAKRKEDFSSWVTTVCIEDTGEGIPEEKKQELMRSIQLGYRTYVGERGSGLGLVICSRIISILQGNLWIEDASPQGTRVCFTLPGPLDSGAE